MASIRIHSFLPGSLVNGGGVRNPTLMAMREEALAPVPVQSSAKSAFDPGPARS